MKLWPVMPQANLFEIPCSNMLQDHIEIGIYTENYLEKSNLVLCHTVQCHMVLDHNCRPNSHKSRGKSKFFKTQALNEHGQIIIFLNLVLAVTNERSTLKSFQFQISAE